MELLRHSRAMPSISFRLRLSSQRPFALSRDVVLIGSVFENPTLWLPGDITHHGRFIWLDYAGVSKQFENEPISATSTHRDGAAFQSAHIVARRFNPIYPKRDLIIFGPPDGK